MAALLSTVAAAFIALPLLGYIVVFIFVKLATKRHRRAVLAAVDASVPLFVASVYFLISVIWNIPHWMIILILILLASPAAFLTRLKAGAKKGVQTFRYFLRFLFFIFLFSYILLLVIGLLKSIILAL